MPLFSPIYIISVFLVFVRISGLLATAPFFAHRSMPIRVKIPFALLVAFSLVGFLSSPPPQTVLQPVGLMVAVGIEALTGVLLGYAAQFIFFSVQYAGEMIGFQMALGMAAVYNPMDGLRSNPIGRFLSMSFLLIFILLNGHHHLLQALVASFRVVPLAGAHLQMGGPMLLDWTGAFFVTALRLAAPFMITIFLVDITLGVFARVAPQANMFTIALALKLLVGLSLATYFVQQFFPAVPGMIQGMFSDLMRLIETLAG